MKILITFLVLISFVTATFAQQVLPSRDGAAQIVNGSGTLTFAVDTSGNGTITPSGTLAIPAAVALTGSALTVGTALASGSLAVTTNATIGGTLAVTGASALAGAVTATSLVVTNGSTLTGGLIVGGGTSVLKILTGAASLDYPSIVAFSTTNLTLTIAGAGTNSTVAVGLPAGLEGGLTACGFVSATNTVSIVVANPTGAAIDPAVGSFRATVFQY